jgi:hypothetical protein
MSAAERERTSSANPISHENRARRLCRARERNALRVLSERSDDDHAFFFKPARTASAVIGICRTRTPTAL